MRGRALREIRADDQGRLLDIFLALEEEAYFGILVLRGRHCRTGHGRFLAREPALQPGEDPVERVSRAVEGLRALLQNALDIEVFIIKGLVFTDMEPDPATDAWARLRNVRVLWRPQSLMRDLASFAGDARTSFYLPPTAHEIEDVAKVLLTRIPEDGAPRATGQSMLYERKVLE